ncbi:hypothetical protein HN014_04115 [Aquimarina sp. TRL1]|nr:hypothetical protein [Aquimarina sp. TRL1]QKX04123.1 hypothetical protein HN014_04115 [Aquimarina sp. TRL1]
MKADKGNMTMNVIFGAFLIVNMVRIGMAIYDRNQKVKEKKQCKCNGKE